MVWKKSKKSGTQKTFFGNNHMIQKKIRPGLLDGKCI